MSYAGVERVYPNECAPDQHDWNPRGDCHRCGVYREHMVGKAIHILELFKWTLSEDDKKKLRKVIE